jgi:hypothetical protein
MIIHKEERTRETTMSILCENLKLYIPFQKQPLMFQVYLVLELLLIIVFIGATLSQDSMVDLAQCNQFSYHWLFIIFMFILFIGQMIAMLQLDVLSKPFSYCLPNHHKIPQRIFLIAGIVTTLIFSFAIIILFQASTLKYTIFILVPFFVVTAFSLTVCFTFKFLFGTFSNLVFKLLLIPFFIVIFFQKDLMISSNDFISYSSIPLKFAALLLLTAVWKTLGAPDLKRKCFERNSNLMIDPNADLFEQLQTIDTRLSQRISDTSDNDIPMVEFFIKAMIKSQFFSIYHSLMGKLYYTFSRYYVLNLGEAVLKIFFAAFIMFLSGYFGDNSMQKYYDIIISPVPPLCLFPMCLLLSSIFAPSSNNLLLPEGRSRRCRVALLLWLFKYLTVVMLGSMVIIVSLIIKDYMPEIELNGYHLIYSYPPIYTILWALVIMPVIDFMFGYVEVPGRLLTMILLASLLFIFSFLAFTINNIAVHIILTVIMIVFTNGLFISLLTRYWFRQDHF